MINLLIAIDLEIKFHRLRVVDGVVDRLAVLAPYDMRRLFTYIYKAYPSKLLLEYELREPGDYRTHHVAHAMVA